MKVKTLVKGDETSGSPLNEAREIRVEFMSENDYFWFYMHTLELDEF